MNQHDVARRVTFALIPSYAASQSIRIVNANLALRPRVGTRSFYYALRDLHQLVAMCPGLRPTAKTLFGLLGHLKRAQKPGQRGFEVAKAFVRRWGHRVLGPDVRRRLVALSHGKSVDHLSALVNTLSVARRRWILSQWARTEPPSSGTRGHAYPHSGSTGWLWRKARIRRRIKMRRAFWRMRAGNVHRRRRQRERRRRRSVAGLSSSDINCRTN